MRPGQLGSHTAKIEKGGYKEKGNIIPFFLVNRRFAFNNISFGKPGTEVNIGAAFGTKRAMFGIVGQLAANRAFVY